MNNQIEIHDSELTFELFTLGRFHEFQLWFRDPDINRHLGPEVDEDWLQHILKDVGGVHYCAIEKKQMVAVVGVVFPTAEHDYFVISDIAVNPSLKRRGYARRVIAKLQSQYLLAHRQHCVAYVDPTNSAAISLFEDCGWFLVSKVPDCDGMLKFVDTTST